MLESSSTRRHPPGASTLTRQAARTSADGFRPGAMVSRAAKDDSAARFAVRSYDAGARTVVAVLSVGSRVPRWGALEELAITREAIDLSRVDLGQVRLLDSHNKSSVDAVLGVVERAWIEGEKLIGRIRFADTEPGRRAEGMVSRGELSGISIGYSVSTWTLAALENDQEIWRADRWELFEVSLVSVPADRDALIRSAQTSNHQPLKGNRMNPDEAEELENATAEAATDGLRGQSNTKMSDRHARDAYALVARANLPGEFARSRIDNGATLEQVRTAVFDELAARADRTRTGSTHETTGSQTFGNPEFLGRSIEDALYSRMTGNAPKGAAVELAGRSILELGSMLLQARGERVSWSNRNMLASQMMDRSMSGAHTTSDFPVLLTGAGQRVLMDAYRTAETPLKALARRRDASDFRAMSTIQLSEAPRLLKVGESGEIKHGSRSEAKESFRVETYARIFSLSRNAIVNDDLGAFADSSIAWGRASAETEADLLVDLLNSNAGNGAKLDDGNPVYGAVRGNKATAGTAISTDALSAGRTALRQMKGLDGVTPIGVRPKHLVVGAAKETEAEKALAMLAAVQVGEVNPFSGKLTLHVEPRLTGNAWRLFADPSEITTLVIAYLNGMSGPQLEVRDGWSTLGTEFRAVLDFGCGFQDWRGTYLNAGNSAE